MSEHAQHATVLLKEAVDALRVKPEGIYVDATFGRGGHSREILRRLGPQGRLIAFDRDPQAIEVARMIVDPRFTVLHAGFSQLKDRLRHEQVDKVDGVLLDLGVSSPQLDDAARGFSFRMDGPLDMRMDTTRGRTAADWLAEVDQRELTEVIADYGEERFAKQVARAIVAARARGPIDSTRKLAAIVAEAVPTREPGQDPATRTFQAIRIFINQELEELSLVLPQCVELLAPGGRLVVISFHSLEDRIVKRFLKREARPDALLPKLPLRADQLPKPRLALVGKPMRPSAQEIDANPRARSAVMRVAERTPWGLAA
ncbi:16S rRNA (cytosine(1402)-N(4))-methyltransferase RsmH [Thiobacter aerophilum]|uniref:Ribosomal RNA small subunit methyltransferase H n=1 Tax=Thiobacter aerophilum TaxID=3121275 RepID=A0ABV0EI26_9BURK